MCSRSDRTQTRSGTGGAREPGSKIKGDGTASRPRPCLHIGLCGTCPTGARATKTVKNLFSLEFFSAFSDLTTSNCDRVRHGPMP